MVNHDPEYQEASIGMAGSEAMGEAAMQIVLQLYIMFSREGRQPSQLQLLSILTSALTIGLPDILTINSRKPRTSRVAVDLYRIAIFIPLYFSTVVFRVTTFALLLVFIRWYFILYYLCLAVLMRVLVVVYFSETNHNTGRNPLQRRETLHNNLLSYILFWKSLTTNISAVRVEEEALTCYRLRKTKMTEWNLVQELWFSAITIHYVEDDKVSRAWRRFHIVFWMCTNTLTLLAILVISNTTDLPLLGLNISWSDLLLVQEINRLNTIIPCTILSGIVSFTLSWQQFNM